MDPFLRPDGDLNPEELRVLIAALAGPLRIAAGRSRRVEFVVNEDGIVLTRNSSRRILYIEVRPIAGQPAVSIVVGENANPGIGLAPEYQLPQQVVKLLVYPGESLYARAVSGGATFANIFEAAL